MNEDRARAVHCTLSRRYVRLCLTGWAADQAIKVELVEKTHPQHFDRKIAELLLPLDELEAAIRLLKDQSADPLLPEV